VSARGCTLALIVLALAGPACLAPPGARSFGEPSPDVASAEAPTALVSDGRVLMGTVLEVALYPAPERDSISDVFALVHRHEKLFSRFDPESTVSALNRSAGQGARPVDPEVVELLSAAKQLSAQTDGAFDVTIGPLLQMWSRAGRRDVLPSPAERRSALARVGSERLQVDRARAQVAIPEGTSLDLGAIAKGRALDASADLLRDRGVEGALLSFGGSSVQAVGTAPGGRPWRILLRDGSGGYAGIVALTDRSLSISQSLAQGYEIAGQRLGHVVDPRSGLALEQPRLVAVVSTSGTRADALSTALLVLEVERGLALVEQLPDTEALVLAAGQPARSTSGWGAFMRPIASP